MSSTKAERTHVWRNYFTMIFRAGLPWALMAVCFLLSLGAAQLALVFANQTADALAPRDNLADATGPLLLAFLIGIAIVLLKVIGAHLQGIVTAKVDRNLQRYAAERVFYLKTADVESGDPRELITRLTEDTTKNSPFLVDLMINEIPRLYYLVVATVQVAGIGRPVLTLTLLGVIPVVFLGSFVSGRLTFRIRNKIQTRIAALTARLAEKINHAETIKAYGTEDKEIAAGDAVIMELDKAKKQGALVDQTNAFIKNLMWFLPLLLIIIPPAVLLFNGEIDQAGFYAYILIATTFRTYTAQHLDLWIYLKDAQGATLRLSGLLSKESEKSDKPAEAPAASNIEFANVSFAYGEHPALYDVSFTVEQGKKTALVGLSGSGKSTTLNLIEKFYDPSAGKILLGGKDIKDMDYAGYRSLFTYLPQNAPGFAGTVRDMLNYCAPKPYADETLTEVLKTVGLYDDLALLGGLEYEIGDGGERLSGGQRQKLGVARLLLCDTPYVLMDEATSALDVEATAALQEAIDKATKGRTLLTVAHDLTTVKNADRILVFDGGRIEASGTHEELLQSSPTYRLLWKEVQAA